MGSAIASTGATMGVSPWKRTEILKHIRIEGAPSLALVAEAAFDPLVEGETRLREDPPYPCDDHSRLSAGGSLQPGGLGGRWAGPPPRQAVSPAIPHRQEVSVRRSAAVDFLSDGKRELLFGSRGTEPASDARRSRRRASFGASDSKGHHSRSPPMTLTATAARKSSTRSPSPAGSTCSTQGQPAEAVAYRRLEARQLGRDSRRRRRRRLGRLFGSRDKYFVPHEHARPDRDRSAVGLVAVRLLHQRHGRRPRRNLGPLRGAGDDRPDARACSTARSANARSLWSFTTDDNASSADPVLVDLDGDGTVEIVKSVDNYAGDDARTTPSTPFETTARFFGKSRGSPGKIRPTSPTWTATARWRSWE